MEKIPENVIHVTGFGPFRGFTKTNPSWEAVKQLPDSIEYNGQEIPIVKHEVPVTYCAVDKKVDEIWETKPKLVVHCGVHGEGDRIRLEQNAFNGKFCEADFAGKKLNSSHIKLQNADAKCQKLCTALNLNEIVNETDTSKIKCSQHPGDYLCGYIYLKSLDMDCRRSLFIHVPPISNEFTVDVVSNGILSVIKQCIKQIDKM